MKFPDLASILETHGKPHSQNILMMPFYQEYGHLARHLDALNAQTSHDFDLIIMLEPDSDFGKVRSIIREKNPGFAVIIAKRKERTGSAGGFFTCQKYALENGYKYTIFADADCIPTDPRLMAKLLEHREAGYVHSTTLRVAGGRVLERGVNIGWYSLLSVKNTLRFGLYYMPLYIGGDDLEYSDRLAIRPTTLENFCEHPPLPVGEIDKTTAYIVQTVLLIRGRNFFEYFLYLALLLPVALVFMPPYGRRAYASAMHSILAYSYGKAAWERARSGFEKFSVPSLPKDPGFERATYAEYVKANFPFNLFRFIRNSWRKDILVENAVTPSHARLAAIFARRLYLRTLSGYLIGADNRNRVAHMLKILVFAALFPIHTMLLLLAVLSLGLLFRPKTMGYGLGSK